MNTSPIAADMPKLLFTDDPHHVFEVELRFERMGVGRGSENDIMVIDASVSRHHAVIERRDGRYVITDLRSRNGVLVNGKLIEGDTELRNGDLVSFGKVNAHFEAGGASTMEILKRDRLPRVAELFQGKYEIERKLGVGSQAEVFLARRRWDESHVALKILRGKVQPGSESESRFLREARTLSRLKHPAIVAVLDAGRVEEIPFITIDYLPGGSLEELLQERGRIDPSAVIKVAQRMAQALEYAHTLGVIHRDVKPSNIMLDGQAQAYVADFGIAKVIEDSSLTASGVIFGTPRYMSPEQFAGSPATARSDIYSLGATLYRCLSGKLPIEGDSIADVVRKAGDPSFTPPSLQKLCPDAPTRLLALVHHCIEKDPDRRPASAAEILRSIEDMAPDQGPQASGTSPDV